MGLADFGAIRINQITIYNSLGQIVKYIPINKTLNNYKINLYGNIKGLYFVGIESDNNTIFRM